MPSWVHRSKWPIHNLLVDQRDQLLHLVAAALRHLEVEGAGEMQRLDVVHPGERNLVVAPPAADQHGDLVVAGALERPVVDRGDAFDHVERIRPWMLRERDLRHAVSDLVAWKWVGSHANHTRTRRTTARWPGTDDCDAESPKRSPGAAD